MVVAEHEALAAAAAASRRSRFRVGLATVPTSSDELIGATAELVAAHGRFHVHLNEVREEVTQSRITRGVTSVELAARTGLLDAQVLAAHCVWLDDGDVALLREHDVAVAHNPVSNMILASGVCPVPRLRREGVTVGLGVDGAASNDSQNMLETMKTAALLQKVHHLQARALTARDVLEMATLGGARALGLADEIGSLEPGKAADLVLFPEHEPVAGEHPRPVPEARVLRLGARRRAGVGGRRAGGDRRAGARRRPPRAAPQARELAVKLATDAGLDSALARG